MAHSDTLGGSFMGAIGRGIFALCALLIIVVFEVIAAMFVYIYLALNHFELFGTLVTFSRHVLNLLTTWMEKFFPQMANSANATLIGELAPKAMLLLLIGLVVGAFIRFLLWSMQRILGWD